MGWLDGWTMKEVKIFGAILGAACVIQVALGVALEVDSEKKANNKAQNYIKSQCEIELEDVEYMVQNIKSITDIKTSRNNEDLFVIINGEFKEKVNNSNSWSVTYSVDDVEYLKLMEMKDLNEKIYFVSDYVIPYYEPVDVKVSKTEMSLEYNMEINEDYEFVR